MSEQKEVPGVLVAVASKGDDQINEHFGHAERFLIYEVGTDGVRFVGERLVEHYCQGGYGDESKRDAILRALADCAACFVARVGDGPRQRLEQSGIAAVDAYPYGLIVPSVAAWYDEHRAKSPVTG